MTVLEELLRIIELRVIKIFAYLLPNYSENGLKKITFQSISSVYNPLNSYKNDNIYDNICIVTLLNNLIIDLYILV